MPSQTMVLVGPGGIGKSPLDRALRPDVHRIDPYRLRSEGPRPPEPGNPPDVYYAHRRLREEILDVYGRLHVECEALGDSIEWFPRSATLFLRVRDDWQLLFLGSLPDGVAKAEIYAPALPVLLERPDIWDRLGQVSMIILNPVAPLATLGSLAPLEAATADNCRLRGDKPQSVAARVASIAKEVRAWRAMLDRGAVEYDNWAYPEHVYGRDGYGPTLVAARKALLDRCPGLAVFLRSEDELAGVAEPGPE